MCSICCDCDNYCPCCGRYKRVKPWKPYVKPYVPYVPVPYIPLPEPCIPRIPLVSPSVLPRTTIPTIWLT